MRPKARLPHPDGIVMTPLSELSRLITFTSQFAALLDQEPNEDTIIAQGSVLLTKLVSHDDWLPEDFARPSAETYQQYLLHLDPASRFCVVSFVWGPGQSTPIHDHRTWGLIGMLRGAEISQAYERARSGQIVARGAPQRLEPGNVCHVSPALGDLHQVSNALADRASISIHVYGVDIGRWPRAAYTEAGEEKLFVSGYSNAASVHGPTD